MGEDGNTLSYCWMGLSRSQFAVFCLLPSIPALLWDWPMK